jgi:hypothetical protein
MTVIIQQFINVIRQKSPKRQVRQYKDFANVLNTKMFVAMKEHSTTPNFICHRKAATAIY